MSTSATASKSGLTLLEWKRLPVPKNTLIGFASVRFSNGLAVNGVTVHQKDGRRWVSMPTKPPRIGPHGQPFVNPRTGKAEWEPVCSWPDRATAEAFSAAVFKLIAEYEEASR